MDDDSLPLDDGPWAMEIGRFVMAFGSIEAWTYHLLRRLPRDPIGQTLIDANLQLKPRLNLLSELIATRDGKEWGVLAALLEQVKVLAEKRNLVAHNGVTLEVLIDQDGGLSFESVIRNRKKRTSVHKRMPAKDRLAFEELVAHRKKAEAIDRALLDAIEEAMGEE